MLIKTKLAPPHQAIDTLTRTALVGRIVSATRPLTVISAPAGYGKTTLLSQCYDHWRQADVAAAWYSVDEGRFESDQFFAYLMAALFQAGLPLSYSREAIEAGLPGLAAEAAARAVALALDISEEPVRLIIDDYHRIASPATDAFLAYVIQRMPAHAAILIATRSGTALPLASLRVQGNLLALDRADLRFTPDEVTHFFAGQPAGINHDLVIAQTEGWPAALQLLRLWWAGRPVEHSPSDLPRRWTHLPAYLAEQIVADLPDDLQHFLLQSAIAERISPGLADAITDGSDGQAQLDRLRRLNLLVTPLDEAGLWFRYHPLLREYLCDALAKREGERLDLLHGRAARWFATAGYLADALQHAARISDPEAGLQIMEAAGGWRVALTGGLAILRHLEGVALDDPVRWPRVWLAQAYLAAQQGRLDEARAAIDRLQDHPELAPLIAADPALDFEILTNDIVARIYEDRPIPADYAPRIEAWLDSGAGDPGFRTLLTHLLCLCCFDAGDDIWCRVHGERACRLSREANLPLIETYLYQYLGLSQLRKGRRREAELYFRRALEHSTRNFGEGSAQVAIASVLVAHSLYLAGDLGAANLHLESALPVIEATEGWHDIFMAGYATRIWMAARDGDVTLAEQVIQRGRDTADRRRLDRLGYQLGLLRVRVRIAAGELDQAETLMALLGAPSEAMVARDARLRFDWRIARLAIAIGRGNPSVRPELEGLVADAGEDRSTALDIEIMTLQAVALVREGQMRDAALAFRRVLEASEGEQLVGLLLQFGALLLPALEACREALNLFEPAQRMAIDRLHRDCARASTRLLPLPPAQEVVVTPREIDVLRALADGLSSKEIARSLGVAESTIKTHRIHIYRKLNVATRSRAILAARNMRLI